MSQRVLVLGGGGYVGSVLCPTLANRGWKVRVLDTFWYGKTLHAGIDSWQGDIRDTVMLRNALAGCSHVIHLACVSNDPSFELSPALGRSINLDSFPAVCEAVRDAAIDRFIYASSSSVYGVHDTPATETTECRPLTDYSRFKLECEQYLRSADMGQTMWTIVRPATVFGNAPRLRLDLVVNALTISALARGHVTVHGGPQKRPNVHIRDLIDAYCILLTGEPLLTHRQTYNVGAFNRSLTSIAESVVDVTGCTEVMHTETDDKRSYHVDSAAFMSAFNWVPQESLGSGIREMQAAYRVGMIPNALTDSRYYNVRRMKELFA